MKLRRMIGNILIILTVAFTVYLSVIMLHRINTVVLGNYYVVMFIMELVVCAFFLLLALDIRSGLMTKMKSRAGKAIGWIFRVFIVFVTGVLLFVAGKVCAGCFIHNDEPAENVIVLGMATENGKPTDDLLLRLDTAAKYLEEHPESVAVLTGGNPDESGRTEAAVMHDILAGRGIAEERMIIEDQSDTTIANYKNTAKLINPDEPVVLISSNYHMDRAVQTAKNAGFTNVLRLPAPSSFITFGSNVMSEVIAETLEMMMKAYIWGA